MTLLEVVSALVVVLGSVIVLWTVRTFERVGERRRRASPERARTREASYRRAA